MGLNVGLAVGGLGTRLVLYLYSYLRVLSIDLIPELEYIPDYSKIAIPSVCQ